MLFSLKARFTLVAGITVAPAITVRSGDGSNERSALCLPPPFYVVNTIAANPEAGEVMPGCGGARKLRVAKPGKGKSGGYRVITYFAGADRPVFLLTVFGKNEKANLSQADRNALAGLTQRLTDTLAG